MTGLFTYGLNSLSLSLSHTHTYTHTHTHSLLLFFSSLIISMLQVNSLLFVTFCFASHFNFLCYSLRHLLFFTVLSFFLSSFFPFCQLLTIIGFFKIGQDFIFNNNKWHKATFGKYCKFKIHCDSWLIWQFNKHLHLLHQFVKNCLYIFINQYDLSVDNPLYEFTYVELRFKITDCWMTEMNDLLVSGTRVSIWLLIMKCLL